MDDNLILLDTKFVGDIEGTFYVPSYQRGYRWGKDEVLRLLNDIYSNGARNYCLQPIVLKKEDNRYIVVDGQQRLTTLHIILSYIKKVHINSIKVKFLMTYQTREKDSDYLSSINEEEANNNIDFYHIFRAYKTINDWFETKKDPVVAAYDFYTYLIKYVKVIWYEVDDRQDAISLFTRLNIGKIPLTSAELVKAMFISNCGNGFTKGERKEEISLIWDTMERELHNDSLWFFLTNKTHDSYSTRIDLILDLVAEKQPDSRDKYFTFFKIYELANNKSMDYCWQKVQQSFLRLKDWYENHDLYHKIGYLIASDKYSLQQLFNASEGKTKQRFHEELDSYIRQTIEIEGNYADLSYKKAADYKKISLLLLLFNIESVRKIDGKTQRFPFDQFKNGSNGKVLWSLEHIHAQQSEGLNTQELWKDWLNRHIPSIRAVTNDSSLIESMKKAIETPKLDGKLFESLQQKVFDSLSPRGSAEYIHSISNLALLKTDNNAAINNSTFDVKRNLIIEMDERGQFIPYCTKMVFLKYYTPSDENQLHFWGQPDRVAYIDRINEILDPYLSEHILIAEGNDK